ncbi:MAG: hypothetical protein IJZ36_04425 [Bacilli bacterium]|nr:hypothetical protein [Bacilli bacterium]
MGSSGLSRWEQETVVNYNNEEKTATVYTADPVVMRKLDKMVDKFPEDYIVIAETSNSKTYKFSKKLIQYRNPIYLTEEQKEVRRQQLKNIRKDN